MATALSSKNFWISDKLAEIGRGPQNAFYWWDYLHWQKQLLPKYNENKEQIRVLGKSQRRYFDII